MTFSSFVQFILVLPRAVKIAIVITIDILICIFTTWLSFYLRLGEWISYFGSSLWRPELASSVSFILVIPLFFLSGIYRSIFRYSGISVVILISKIVLIYALIYSCVFTGFGILGIPRTIGLIQPIILLLFILASRASARYWLGGMYQDYFRREDIAKVLIYGAGIEGRQLADALLNSREMRVVGFVDDDSYLIGQVLNGQPIYAINDLEALTKNLGIKVVLLAIPRVSHQRRNQIIKKITQLKIIVRTLPSVNELAQGRLQNDGLRDLDIGDLLGRDPIPPNESLLKTRISNKTVMVTGAGGSIGSELCNQILNLKPRILLLIDSSEYALYSIDNLLKEQVDNKNTEIIPLLTIVQDSLRMSEIIETWMPDTIYHAAAYKHVPLVEQNPIEGISNNVFGTLVLAELAARYQVSDFVLISTDKAVRPTNIMGATKRLSEMILQSLNSVCQCTRFSMVRFGNVLGSSGSVVPRFSAQIQRGGPITLTHLDITRYFMTIPEAAQLVIQAGAMASGGEVFVLDMGEPVRILDLAKNMVELSGHSLKSADNQGGDISIEITGLRPSEKLYEELLIGDNPKQTDHPRIMKANEAFLEWEILSAQLEELKTTILKRDVVSSILVLNKIVTNYKRSENVNDWVYLQNLRE
jgi:FlaA1/EpsC-like NDP-sugar epimerase